MKTKKKVVRVQQLDKDIPIELYRIEKSVDLFEYEGHYQYDFYQIYWFTEVLIPHKQEIDFVSYPVIAGEIWIIYPGQVHHFDPRYSRGYCLAIDKNYFHSVLFKEAKLRSFIGHGQLKFAVPFHDGQRLEYLHVLMEIEFNSFKRPTVLEQYLQLYFIHLQDLPLLSQPHMTMDDRVYKILQLIEEHYSTQQKNEFYAEQVFLSVKRMNEILFRAIGKTLKQQLQERLLLEAKRLVGYSEDTIQRIAHALHFSDVTYFNRFFKKHTHQTPKDFREQVQKVQDKVSFR
ncbi:MULTISPECIES: AraC family transcriptional regulator [unclassified Myroides]|uniref:helix-turn-helix domain-containing protein n=1 Tax=unclassified Myroides TaxID=2642485 RepID=UPI0015FE2881|nr:MULTISPECIES: AraC family transcriptional regulator [unclassified Myroides]MBB1151144.1 helix-turn-helix transcriptional regulator [Myroides sp. NP-2]MDM1408762.1 helix-turn-helix transcriptional regulator [Myroides sp. DF42-4-2]